MTGHAVALPRVEYAEVDPGALIPPSVEDQAVVPFGFNDGSVWSGVNGGDDGEVDDGYLRYQQPMEAELANQVEYDMDEQDQVWLEMVNHDRERAGDSPVSLEVFEIIFDKVEKEWFNLEKRIPKKHNPVAIEESKCAICDDGECENSNAIVFCDGCNLAVHQDCYGVPYIPEGQWLCRKCTVAPDKLVSCVLCPNAYGAFKQTTTAQWAHLLCAIWIPDTGVSNTVYMEPIDGVENISKSRWKLHCYLCKKRMGACIQCANRNCFSAFHVTCARERGLELKMRQGVQGGELKAYCEKHSPNFVPPPAMSQSHKKLINNGRQLGGKTAQAYKKSYSQGPPVIPNLVFGKVMDYVTKLELAKKDKFVSAVCRYWSLKREARRGAPLLKRLHLEPWTANASLHNHSDEELAKRINLMRLLREDLEKVRMLTEQVRKREQLKLRRVKALQAFVTEFVFAKEGKMRAILDDLVKMDKNAFFLEPVSEEYVPGYRDVIKNPMDFSTMRTKLEAGEYKLGAQFADDVNLIMTNAKRFNAATFSVHKHAVKIQAAAEPMLAELRAMDEPDSAVGAFEQNMAEVLSTEAVDELFAYDYDPKAVYDEPAAVAIDLEEVQAAARYAAAVKAAAAPKVDRWEGKNRPGRKRKSELLAMEEARKNAPPRNVVDRLRRVSTNPNPDYANFDPSTPQRPQSVPNALFNGTPNPHTPFDPTAGPSRPPASAPKEKKTPQLNEDGKPKRAPREGRMLPRGAACLACRNRKVRCDSVKPQCGPCMKAGNRYGPCDYVWMLRKMDGAQVDRVAAAPGEDGMTPRVKKPRPSLETPGQASPGSPAVAPTPESTRRITVVQPREPPAKGVPNGVVGASAGKSVAPNSTPGSLPPRVPYTGPLPASYVAAGSPSTPASANPGPPVKRKPGRPPKAAAAAAVAPAPQNGLTDHDQFDLFNTGYILPEGQTRGGRRRTIASVEPDVSGGPPAKKGRRESMPNLGQVPEEEVVVPETSQPVGTQSSTKSENVAAVATPVPVRVGGRQTRGTTTSDSPALVALPYGERWKPKPKEEVEETATAPADGADAETADAAGNAAAAEAEGVAAVIEATEGVAMTEDSTQPEPTAESAVPETTQDEPMQVDETPEPASQLVATPDDEAKPEPTEPTQPEASGTPSLPATPQMSSARKLGRHGSASKQSVSAAIKQFEDEIEVLNEAIAVRPEHLEDGTLVWASVKGWPAMPAEYCNPRDKETPDYIREMRPANWRTDGLHPVLFFDETAKVARTGMWLPLSDLRLFGESARADELLSSEAAVQKKYRQKGPHKVRAEYKKLRAAYESAKAIMQNEEDVQNEVAEVATKGKGSGRGRGRGRGKGKGK